VLEFYLGLPGREKTMYAFSLCVVLLLSNRFTASAFVWISNFLKYLVFQFLFHFVEPEVVYIPMCIQNGSESP
jgi:hypothetical protein